ncbi:MAG: hypothetical protein K5923_02560 [Clostridia bacterium]|nr:hypothetical protein [Clostridia bacterium]
MTKKLIKFQFDVIFNNKQLLIRVCLILSIAMVLAILATWGLGSTTDNRDLDEEWIESLNRNSQSTLEYIKRQELEYDYENSSWYEAQDARYFFKSAKAECEYYIATNTNYQDYYSLDSAFEAYFKEYNPASRIMIWTFLSTMLLFAFSGLFPLAFSNKKDKYKNLMILGNTSKDIAISEMVVQYIALFALWLLFAIVGSFLGIGSHHIYTLQYNNGNVIAVSIYTIFIIKQLMVIIVSMFLMSISIMMNTYIKNKLLTSIISISLFLVPLLVSMEFVGFGLSMQDIGVIYFPIINIVMDDWLVGNYKLIWISLIYVILTAGLCTLKIIYEAKRKLA